MIIKVACDFFCFYYNNFHEEFSIIILSDSSTGAVVPPISLATTFAQSSLGNLHGRDNPNSHFKGYEYSRTGNPTRGAFERAIAAVEHAKYGIAFSSGLVYVSIHRYVCIEIEIARLIFK